MKTVLELSPVKAKSFFLKQQNYCSVDLPQYFDFQPLLDGLSKKITADKSLNIGLKELKKVGDANYVFFTKKDNKFAWRQLQIINPALYIFLVCKITQENNWKSIVDRFAEFQKNQQIECCSIPVISAKSHQSDKAESILNWWNKVEQQSIELALRFDCFLNTDIADCYASIYTHSIAWALHCKEIIKNKNKDKNKDKSKNKSNDNSPNKNEQKLLGEEIDCWIRSMQFGQTNGIPQGSVLMDFIAEMVLGYADLLLSEKIKEAMITDYQILRYRDDYRVFTNSQNDAEKIAKLLTEVLVDLNLRLNSNKTFLSTDIIQDAIKPDKLYRLREKKEEKTLQATLLLILLLSKKYPNSGSVIRSLSEFQKRLHKKQKVGKENIKVLISIVVDIAYRNPNTYSMAIAILSKLISFLNDNNALNEIVDSIERKFNKVPNVGNLQVWLQRLTLKVDENKNYDEKLCKKIIDDKTVIWNIDCLKDDIKKIFSQQSIINRDYISAMDPIINPEEVQLFKY